MDRFEGVFLFYALKYLGDLHSSMDRFEAVEAMGNSSVEANLHSSMDRFEVLTVMIVNLQGFIYIPVWIDLK